MNVPRSLRVHMRVRRLLYALPVFAVAPVSGQSVPSCSQMQAVISAQAPIDSLATAERFIRMCPNAGGSIGRAWSLVPSDFARLRHLYESADEYRVQEVFDSLRSVAQNPARPLPVRQWAIVALLSWGAPAIWPPYPSELAACASGGACGSGMFSGRKSERSTTPGRLTAQNLLATWYVDRFADNTSEPDALRYTALGAAQVLADQDPSAFLPLGNRLAAAYKCGSKWRIVNRSRVMLRSIAYEIDGKADKKLGGLEAVPLGRQADTLVLAMRLFGRLRISMGSTTLMTVQPGVEGPVPCR